MFECYGKFVFCVFFCCIECFVFNFSWNKLENIVIFVLVFYICNFDVVIEGWFNLRNSFGFFGNLIDIVGIVYDFGRFFI